MAAAAIVNAVWDLYGRRSGKPVGGCWPSSPRSSWSTWSTSATSRTPSPETKPLTSCAGPSPAAPNAQRTC
ncbi:hypothetical protein E4K10_04130 [Streptomyces sp. T1317-0309]|nr:hypothetical protein E4K10_04130 [Streptomyces sp. T1317-0309]